MGLRRSPKPWSGASQPKHNRQTRTIFEWARVEGLIAPRSPGRARDSSKPKSKMLVRHCLSPTRSLNELQDFSAADVAWMLDRQLPAARNDAVAAIDPFDAADSGGELANRRRHVGLVDGCARAGPLQSAITGVDAGNIMRSFVGKVVDMGRQEDLAGQVRVRPAPARGGDPQARTVHYEL